MIKFHEDESQEAGNSTKRIGEFKKGDFGCEESGARNTGCGQTGAQKGSNSFVMKLNIVKNDYFLVKKCFLSNNLAKIIKLGCKKLRFLLKKGAYAL